MISSAITPKGKMNEPVERQAAPQGRLYSLDLLRGLDIFFLTVFCGIAWAAHEGLGLFPVPAGTPAGCFGPVMEQLAHRWGRFHLIDIVMPMFIYMCGAAIPFALGRRLKAGRPTAAFWRHVGARFALLWFCGLVAQGNLLSLEPSKIRVFDNTLQTIACGYVIAALTMLIRRRWVRWLVPAALALVYTVPLAAYGDYTPNGNLAHLVERWIVDSLCVPLGFSSKLTDYTWFATIPMFGVMTLLGMISTEILTDRAATGKAKALRLGALGAGTLALGWAAYPFIPSIKHIFTLTFTAQAMGWCMLSLALLYYVTDVLGFRRGLGLFILFGQFALTAYMLVDTPLVAITAKATETFTQGFAHLFGEGRAVFLASIVQGALVTFALIVRRRLKARK